MGGKKKIYGFPHFKEARFTTRFPFATVELKDAALPLSVELAAWNPFILGDADASSLPIAGLEYRFVNGSAATVDAVYSFHAENFMAAEGEGRDSAVRRVAGGFVLEQPGRGERSADEGRFAAWVDEPETRTNLAWFRGGWFDPLTLVWKSVQDAVCMDQEEVQGEPSPGGSLYVPIRLAPGEAKTIVLKWAWYVPFSDLHKSSEDRYRPWYATVFPDLQAVRDHWTGNYADLRRRSRVFTDAFYDSTLPPVVLDAVSANLAILKFPTVLRQHDGRVWAWESCRDYRGGLVPGRARTCGTMPSLCRTCLRTSTEGCVRPSSSNLRMTRATRIFVPCCPSAPRPTTPGTPLLTDS